MKDLICPSDTGILFPFTPSGSVSGPFIPTNYCFSEADFLYYSYGKYGNVRSPFGMRLTTVPADIAARWGSGAAYGIESITDGTSNTIILSERCATPGNRTEIVDTFKGGVYGQGFDPWWEEPINCMEKAGTSGKYPAGSQPKGGSGTNFAYFQLHNGFFFTIIPPNGPSCAYTNGSSFGSWGPYLPPVSYHKGGVNSCFADGSGRFVSDMIGYGDLTKYPTYYANSGTGSLAGGSNGTGTGPSPFGVWGALGSQNGGESNAL